MGSYLGILFAFGALAGWGVGDFYIQRTSRNVGIWKSLFFIGVAGMVGLFPFIGNDFRTVLAQPRLLFLFFGALGPVVTLAALANFWALKNGKISVVAPITGMELPIAVGLSMLFAHERLDVVTFSLILVVFVGILLISVSGDRQKAAISRPELEKGVFFALIGAFGLAATNVLTGLGSRETSPLFSIWFTHTFVSIVAGTYLIARRQLTSVVSDLVRYPTNIILQSVLDNAAWISFAYATVFIPISVATAISECFIILSTVLGVVVGHERLRRHQIVGIALAIVGIIFLSFVIY